MKHLVAYWVAVMICLIGMFQGYYSGSETIIQIGMAAAAVIFGIYSVGEYIMFAYPYLSETEPEEEEDDGSNDRPRERD